MLGVTLFGIFLTPVFYLVIRWISGNKPLGEHGAPKKEDAEPEASHSPEPVAAH
jgi:multidrug efflux pump